MTLPLLPRPRAGTGRAAQAWSVAVGASWMEARLWEATGHPWHFLDLWYLPEQKVREPTS